MGHGWLRPWHDEEAPCLVERLAKVREAEVELDEVDEVAVFASGGIGPPAGRSPARGRAVEPDVEAAPRLVGDVADGPVAALAAAVLVLVVVLTRDGEQPPPPPAPPTPTPAPERVRLDAPAGGPSLAVGITEPNPNLFAPNSVLTPPADWARWRDELVKLGAAADRVQVSGRGEREPLVATADEVAEPKNRRVEVTVR